MTRVIVFDFGNVVAHFSHDRIVEQLAAISPLDPEAIYDRVLASPLDYELDVGAVPVEAFRAELRRRIEARSVSDADLDRAFSDMFTRNDAICDALPLLARRHRLVLLSNTNALHAAHFTRQFARELGHFQALVFSHEVRARKPDAAIYLACQERADCRPGDILFVDDREENVATARSLGWEAIHYQPMAGLPDRLRALAT